jgi:hypothetical protein
VVSDRDPRIDEQVVELEREDLTGANTESGEEQRIRLYP